MFQKLCASQLHVNKNYQKYNKLIVYKQDMQNFILLKKIILKFLL